MGMDIFGRKPRTEAGKYFRANVWSWRPIHQLCEDALNKKLPSWGYNDGAGLETQNQCDHLANELAALLANNNADTFSLASKMRVTPDGHLFNGKETQGKSAYSTSREHVQEFITFLRACGGFKIL